MFADRPKRRCFHSPGGGFTLIELLMVIAIISLLVSILMPSLRYARIRAGALKCASQMRILGTGLFAYAGENRGRIPPTYISAAHSLGTVNVGLIDYHGLWVMWSGPGFSDHKGLWGLGYLYPHYMPNHEMFYCPVQAVKGSELIGYKTHFKEWFGDPSRSVGAMYLYRAWPRYNSYQEAADAGQIAAVTLSLEIKARNNVGLVADLVADHLHTGPVHEVGFNVLYAGGNVEWYNCGRDSDYIQLGNECEDFWVDAAEATE